jgi:GTP-binding protein HflX
VGFIHKLPHHLIQAFRATLEELRYADILLHVVDCSAPDYTRQMRVVYDTLKELNCLDKPCLTAFNKIDLLPRDALQPADAKAALSVHISALTGKGLESLLTSAEDMLKSMRTPLTVLIPYGEGQWVSIIHESCEVLSEEHTETGTAMSLYADTGMAGKLARFTAGFPAPRPAS